MEPVRFRPAQRAVASDYFPENDDESDGNRDQDNDTSTQTAAIAKARRRARFQGVAFRAGGGGGGASSNQSSSSSALVKPETQVLMGIDDRFTKQTGLISDINDRHMNEYIESRLRKAEPDDDDDDDNDYDYDDDATEGDVAAAAATRYLQSQPSTKSAQPLVQGKLMEVEVPRQSQGNGQGRQVPTDSDAAPSTKHGKARKRRGSDDIKRDKMVEEFLHENRLDVYDVPEPQTTSTGVDGEADERLSRQFRQQFQEEMARRRERKRLAIQSYRKKPAGKGGLHGGISKPIQVLRGPKLGGSRNSRAAVRNALLEQAREKAKR
ncbi:hypothetical protein GMORB2_5757 [Geosmithia morbida]|uniref:Uncharacterized protein n=1 Tax=Geosmithia morbida TaxID=1094350 RepID=A0A9P4YVU8_9HYPO|nr:uncharacterized protein GMORB2_5757 [Geosmithia morbida]KAF4124041.1 hypothetical protein GMORB2_5757 [Geosmithia morbida]